jgi:hypothetical protein
MRARRLGRQLPSPPSALIVTVIEADVKERADSFCSLGKERPYTRRIRSAAREGHLRALPCTVREVEAREVEARECRNTRELMRRILAAQVFNRKSLEALSHRCIATLVVITDHHNCTHNLLLKTANGLIASLAI